MDTITKAAHTSGPWSVEPRQYDQGASLAIVAPNHGYIVAIVPYDDDIQTEDEPDYSTVVRHPTDEPNARLIAAAPAMLEALKASENWLSELAGPDDDTPDTGLRGLLVDVRHAIARAEGK